MSCDFYIPSLSPESIEYCCDLAGLLAWPVVEHLPVELLQQWYAVSTWGVVNGLLFFVIAENFSCLFTISHPRPYSYGDSTGLIAFAGSYTGFPF